MRILKFSTPTCTYCKVVAPHIKEYAENNGYEVLEINADPTTNSNIDKQYTELYDVMSVPVMVFEGSHPNEHRKYQGFGDIMQALKE